MIKSKVAAIGLALIMTSGLAFADSEFSFTNKVSSDIVNIAKEGDSDTDSTFAGIKNKTTFEFTSDKVDAMVELVFWSVKAPEDDNNDYFLLGASASEGAEAGYDFGDTFVEVRPFDFLGFEFHEKMWTSGSYFPIWDDNASAGNIGSDLGAIISPVEGLKIAAGCDFGSLFGKGDYKPVVNFGAEYANEVFALGAAVRNIADESVNPVSTVDGIQFGVYGSFLKAEGLVLNAGFGYNTSVEPDVAAAGGGFINGNVFSLTGTYEKEAFHSALDFATNFADSDDMEYDFYLALSAGYNVLESLSLDCAFATALDAESDSDKKRDARFQVNPTLTYTLGNHEFSAGVNVFFGEDYTNVNFPVYWKYSL